MGSIFSQLGIALGLGLLVGLQRESVATRLAGLRTFPLITLLGALCGFLAITHGGWIIAAGLIALATLIYAGKESENRTGHPDSGLTTEISILLMFGVGAILVIGPPEIAITIGGITAVLLHFKGELHTAAARLTARDLRVIMQFALISLVILPVLPNRPYGPYQVINPRNIWFMVVLIVGIGLSGYIIYKFFGEEAGLLLSGLLGGVISSTATTVTFSRRSRVTGGERSASIAILLASSVVFVRVQVEMAAVSTDLLRKASIPLFTLMAVTVSVALWLWFRGRRSGEESLPEQANPSELGSAFLFGGLYALILLLVAFTEDRFGSRGLYLVAALSGLTDVDAITLSTAQLVKLDRLTPGDGGRLVVVAILSNLVFKLGLVLSMGARMLKLHVGAAIAAAIGLGLLLLRFWRF